MRAVLRAKCLMARMILRLQVAGFSAMLGALAAFRRAAGQGDQRYAVVGLTHMWDDTTQRLRERRPAAGARQPQQKVGKTVLVQKSMVHALAVEAKRDGSTRYYSRGENWIIPAIEMPGKSAQDLRRAMLASGAVGRHGALDIEDKSCMTGLSASLDAMVLTMWGDGAASNGRWLRHLCGVAERDAWPTNVLLDPQQVCLLHQAHRVKTYSLESHSLIGLLFCLSKLVRTGSVWPAFVDEMTTLIDNNTERVPFVAPPKEKSERARMLLNMVYDLDGAHHCKPNGNKSLLYKDVEFLLEMDNGIGAGDTRFVHYCHHPDAGVCCSSLADTKAKLKQAYCNLFMSHAFPSGTLSRWTHVRIILGIVLSSMMCRNILFRALAPALQKDIGRNDIGENLSVASVGAGDSDMQIKHTVRKQKVLEFLSRQQTPWELVAMFSTVGSLDKLVYFLMRGGEQQARKPGTLAKAEQPIPMRELLGEVRLCRSELLKVLQDFDEPGSNLRTMLAGVGCSESEANSEACKKFFRRLCLQMSSGVFRRFELRLAAFPYKLWILADREASEIERQQVADEFLSMPKCCIGYFGTRVRALFDTRELLLGPKCKLVIMVWLRTLVFSIYACEREHASVRRFLCGQGPGRSFSLVVRDRMLECTRTIHVERGCSDPRETIDSAPAKRRRLPLPEEPEDGNNNPLYANEAEIHWGNEAGQGQQAPPPLLDAERARHDQGAAQAQGAPRDGHRLLGIKGTEHAKGQARKTWANSETLSTSRGFRERQSLDVSAPAPTGFRTCPGANGHAMPSPPAIDTPQGCTSTAARGAQRC